jgi:hypothetical protein
MGFAPPTRVCDVDVGVAEEREKHTKINKKGIKTSKRVSLCMCIGFAPPTRVRDADVGVAEERKSL